MLPFLGIACGAGVANIYYNQPLLLEISSTFHVPAGRSGLIAVATQVGYAAGILLFVPMGDVVERRSLIVRLFGAVAVALGLAAVAPSLWVLSAASVAIGLTAAVTHILVPIAPEFADEQNSGKAIGTVMTGLLLGVLLARVFSGVLAALFGWRSVFLIAALCNLAFVPLLHRYLPKLPPVRPVPYSRALRSLWTIFRKQPVLREASLVGLLVFAAFSTFWTTLAFLLGSEHYRLGAEVAGSFGLIGATGALIARPAGRLCDREGPRAVLSLGLAMLAAGFVIFWVAGYHLIGLIIGLIVLDIGQQAMQISNQTRIFSLLPGARARINTVYMTIFFFGAAAGSYGSTLAWTHWRWNGVCALGLAFLAAAALVHAAGARRGRA